MGFDSPSYRLVDLSAEQVPHSYRRGLAQGTVGRTWKEADFRISFGKMRSHPVEMAHLTVGNVEWIGARCDDFLFPERQARRETAIMMLAGRLPAPLRPAGRLRLGGRRPGRGDGLPEPQGTPTALRLARCPALDVVAARHMGVRDPRESSILRAACHWFGGRPVGANRGGRPRRAIGRLAGSVSQRAVNAP